MPCIPLALAGPAGPPIPQVPGTGPRWDGPGQNPSGRWLRNAAAGLCVLAAAAAAVSFIAQYRMVNATRHLPVIAALEASIPDAAALVFACLGIALALHGRRALRARALNLASVAASVFMNAIAAAPGWRDLAIWIMPPVAYALASDTLIGVVRARAIARRHHLAAFADDTATPLAALGGLIMWLLRLILAPVSTLTGSAIYEMTEAAAPAGTITQAFSWLSPASELGAAPRSRRRPTPRHNPPVVATAIETLPSGNRQAAPCPAPSRSPIIERRPGRCLPVCKRPRTRACRRIRLDWPRP